MTFTRPWYYNPAPMPDTGITVIGGGVVGLAIAARLAPRHRDLVILERNPMTVAPGSIGSIPVLATVVGGAFAYERPMAD